MKAARMRSLALKRFVLIFGFVCAAASQPLFAIEWGAGNSLGHLLGGHNFVPVLSIPPPFIDTQTNLTIAGGYGDYPSNILAISNNLQLAAFEPIVNIQYAVVPWLALSLGLHATTVAGTNAQSVAIYGASLQTSTDLGAVIKLVETEKFILSLGLITQFPHYQSLSPLSSLDSYNKVVSVITPDFVYPNVSSVWQPSARMAYAFNPTFGLRALLGARLLSLSQDVEGQSTANLNFGLGVSADLKPSTGVPLAFTANFKRNQIIHADGVNGNLYSFGMYETFWTQTAFGLEVGIGDTLGQNTTVAGLAARVYY